MGPWRSAMIWILNVPKGLVLKAWLPDKWHCWEVVETLGGRA
jgi:hypothetical protein